MLIQTGVLPFRTQGDLQWLCTAVAPDGQSFILKTTTPAQSRPLRLIDTWQRLLEGRHASAGVSR
jgi:hypothetical protein